MRSNPPAARGYCRATEVTARPSVCRLIAKFHYTDPTGPDPTRQSPRTLTETLVSAGLPVWLNTQNCAWFGSKIPVIYCELSDFDHGQCFFQNGISMALTIYRDT